MKVREVLVVALLLLLPAIANAGGETGNGRSNAGAETGNGRGANSSAPVESERLN